MKKMKPMLALLAFLPAFAASPLPAADQEMECKMCKECPMCREKMEKMKGMEKMKDMPEGKPAPQMERMQKMQRMMQEKMQGMEPRERMELMERMQRERMEPKPPMDRGMDRERMEPRGPMERPQRESMERMQRLQPKMPPPPIGPMDVKKRLAEMDLAATVQQYGKVRHMLEETKTELSLLEQKEGAEEETAMLSKRLEALGKLADELRGKAEACCEMDGKKEPGEQPGAHDHGDKQKDGDKHDQPAKPEEGKPAAEPHH